MKQKQDREKFYFFKSYYESIKDLPKKNRSELCEAIVRYSFEDEYNPEFKGTSLLVWKIIKPFLDNSFKQFQNGSRNSRN